MPGGLVVRGAASVDGISSLRERRGVVARFGGLEDTALVGAGLLLRRARLAPTLRLASLLLVGRVAILSGRFARP
jgi:hypothetical protein